MVMVNDVTESNSEYRKSNLATKVLRAGLHTKEGRNIRCLGPTHLSLHLHSINQLCDVIISACVSDQFEKNASSDLIRVGYGPLSPSMLMDRRL